MSGPLGLGSPPSITDPDAAQNFAADCDAFFTSLAEFEQNLVDYGNAVSLGFYSTSSTSITLAPALLETTVTLTVAPNKGFAVGFPVRVSYPLSPSVQWLYGIVTAYNSSTGSLSVYVKYVYGSGQINSWNVTLCPIMADNGASGTSATNVAVPGVGQAVAMTASRDMDWIIGDTLLAAASATNRFIGTVTAYNRASGSLTLLVAWAIGSGSYGSWAITRTSSLASTLLWSTINNTASSTIDCSLAVYFTRTVNGATTFNFTNAPAGQVYGFTLRVTHTSGAITWPASVKWPENVPPLLTTGKVHLFHFVTDDGGTTWRGAGLLNYSS